MPPFIHDDFLLQTRTARRLYQHWAQPEPILDFHCHLSPRDLAENRLFENLSEIWLEGDHYKWRAMRANGVAERFCTGAASPWEKFKAWAASVPQTLRNPLYHWTHLELTRYFGITELLNERSAQGIWEEANAQLALPEFSTQGLLRRFRVTTLCTTDDPADDLRYHHALARLEQGTRVLPCFRPDAVLAIERPAFFRDWLQRLEGVSGAPIQSLPAFLAALRARVLAFHECGCRLSDHSLERCFAEPCTAQEAEAIFLSAQAGRTCSNAEYAAYVSFIMLFLGQMYAEMGWTMQLHLGALRSNNTRLFQLAGPDSGFDSIGDSAQAASLSKFLNALDLDERLPKTIIYNLNPADNYVVGAMIGNFQDGSVAGKVQLGSGWWFMDQKEGMEWQLNTLSNLGLLGRFVGMVTDSRSFMSYPRHEYFRRVLCNLLGRDMEAGELPQDEELIGSLVKRVCYSNARDYLGLESLANSAEQEPFAHR